MSDDELGITPEERPFLEAAVNAIGRTAERALQLRWRYGVPVVADLPAPVLDACIRDIAGPLVRLISTIDDPVRRHVAIASVVCQLLRNFAIHAPALGSSQWNKNEQLDDVK